MCLAFRTYTTLIQQPAKGKQGKSRLQQVIEWVGGSKWDGCLIFDEVILPELPNHWNAALCFSHHLHN